jgi:hypothetical protein
MRFVSIARSATRVALASPILCLILTGAPAPVRADVIEVTSTVLAKPIYLSFLVLSETSAAMTLSGSGILPPFPNDFDLTISIFHGNTASKQNLFEEWHLDGDSISSYSIDDTVLGLTETLHVLYTTFSAYSVDLVGGFDLLTLNTAQYDRMTAISAVADIPVAPEPSTWAMALLGFAGLGLIGYGRARWRDGGSLASAEFHPRRGG